MRKIINLPSTITCQIRQSSFSSYGFPAHLKWEHSLTSKDYVKQYGEFRKGRYISKNKRQVSSIECKICSGSFSSVGMATHLRDSHGLMVDEYVNQYGEFRKKYLKLNLLKNTTPQVECKICGETMNDLQLSYHVRLKHGIEKLDYIKTYIFPTPPLCDCGCGESPEILTYFPYRRSYIKHHKKSTLGFKFSDASRQKMVESANRRVERQRKTGFPFVSPSAILKRKETNKTKILDKFEQKYNISILERNKLDDREGYSYRFRCNTCGSESPEQFHHQYFICATCYPSEKSQCELEIKKFLEEHNIHVETNNRSILSSNRELDIFIPSANVAIEYNGLYYHSENAFGKDRKYHLSKTEECESLGIQLIHIFEDEWLMKKEIVMSKLLQKCQKFNQRKIFARNCTIQSITKSESDLFLNQYHLQGKDTSKIRYGLFYDNELIAVMTFGKQNLSRGIYSPQENTYELVRFASRHDVLCVGGASKLFKKFIADYSPKSIISYADRRWSTQNSVYPKLGFTFDHYTQPSYWYIPKGYQVRRHRFNFTKKKVIEMGGDPNLTEWENMKLFGYDRIWDCGHLKYSWTSPSISPS